MAISTSTVDYVLKTWANNYIEDVPAQHVGGRYLIDYEDLVEHLNTLSYEALAAIMLDAAETYIE